MAALDGHQHASYRRHGPGCRRRTVKTEHGERIQYYHRQVTLLVLANALYATAPFLNFLIDRGKHALVVLKDERRNLYPSAANSTQSSARKPATGSG